MTVRWPARDLVAEANTAAWSAFLNRWAEKRAAERRSQPDTETPLSATRPAASSGHPLAGGNRNRGRRAGGPVPGART